MAGFFGNMWNRNETPKRYYYGELKRDFIFLYRAKEAFKEDDRTEMDFESVMDCLIGTFQREGISIDDIEDIRKKALDELYGNVERKETK